MKKCIFLICLLFLISCNKKPGKSEFKIEGFLSNGEDKVLVINEISPNGNIFIDSLLIDKNGEFEFIYKMPYKSFYTIGTKNDEFVTLLPDYQEIVRLNGNYESLSPTYSVEGSVGSKLLWELNNKEIEGIQTLNNINKTWEIYKDSINNTLVKEQLDSVYYETWLNQKIYYYDFIYDNRGSLAVIMALYKTFNRVPLFPVITESEVYNEVLDGLKESIPDNPHTKHFETSYRRKTIQNDSL